MTEASKSHPSESGAVDQSSPTPYRSAWQRAFSWFQDNYAKVTGYGLLSWGRVQGF